MHLIGVWFMNLWLTWAILEMRLYSLAICEVKRSFMCFGRYKYDNWLFNLIYELKIPPTDYLSKFTQEKKNKLRWMYYLMLFVCLHSWWWLEHTQFLRQTLFDRQTYEIKNYPIFPIDQQIVSKINVILIEIVPVNNLMPVSIGCKYIKHSVLDINSYRFQFFLVLWKVCIRVGNVDKLRIGLSWVLLFILSLKLWGIGRNKCARGPS